MVAPSISSPAVSFFLPSIFSASLTRRSPWADYYDVNATQFKAYLTDLHNTFNRPIWVTEWACQNYNGGKQCSQDGVAIFMNETQSFMDQTDWVERYSWFGAMENLQGVNTVS
jgi:hypothetical protein